MSGIFLRNGGGQRAAQYLLNRRALSPLLNSQSRSFVRSNLLSSKSSTHLKPSNISSSSSSSTTTYAKNDSNFTGNGLVGWYLRMIGTRPVLTKSLTAGAIFTAADVSSQMVTLNHQDSLDLIRTLRMAGYGMLVSGPSLHLWFNTVSRFLPKRDISTTLKKMFLGQAVYGPIMTAIFFSINAGLQGETAAEIFARLRRDLIPTLLSGVVYWPMCDFVTFKFTPVHLQPLVSNSFSFLWTIYITYMASSQKASTEDILTDS